MEEDMINARTEALGPGRYTVCTACGAPIPRDDAVLLPGEEVAEARSEQGEVCQACLRGIKSGEYVTPEAP